MSDASERFGDWVNNKVVATTAAYGFQVENILVEGRTYTDAETLKAIVNLDQGDPIFLFKPDQAKQMIEKLSWVKSVRVERRLPDTIYIGLNERVPLALWQHNKKLSLIDTEGVILTENDLSRFKDFIVVVGDDIPVQAPEFLSLLKVEPSIWEQAEAATLVSGRRWDLKLKTGIVVKLPEDNTAVALRRLALMQEKDKLMDKNISVIDIRDQERITIQTKPGAVQKYKAGFQTSGLKASPI